MANYTPLIKLDPDTMSRLKSYLSEELRNHYSERQAQIDRLIQFQHDYWAESANKVADFPFKGAATIVIPLTAIAVEAFHARTMTTLFTLPNFVSAKALDPQWADSPQALETFVSQGMTIGGVQSMCDNAVLEIEKLGTGVAKSGYERIVRTAVRVREDGTEEEFSVVVKDGLALNAVPLAKFLMPYYANDPQDSPWCGEEQSRSPYQIKQMEESGYFEKGTYEALLTWVTLSPIGMNQERQYEHSQQLLERRDPVWPKVLDFQHIWMSFDVTGEGDYREVVVDFHIPSQMIMGVRYNWHDDLHKPYRKGVFFPLEHRWFGIGICHQNIQFQEEITAQHRQRLDAGTISISPMFKLNRSSGYGTKEPIFPGKIWFLDDMTHFDAVQMGTPNPVAFSNEQATLLYSQQRTGVNEVVLGMSGAGTPGTATDILARVQESNKKFDYIYRNIKRFTNDIVIDSVQCIKQYGGRLIQMNTNEKADRVAMFFSSVTDEQIRNNTVVQFHTAGQQENKLTDRQNWTQISQILQQYFTGAIQLGELTQNPQIIQLIAMKGIAAITEAMRQVLMSFDVRNIDRIILVEIEAMILGMQNATAQPGLTQPGSQPAGLIVPQNSNANGGMVSSAAAA